MSRPEACAEEATPKAASWAIFLSFERLSPMTCSVLALKVAGELPNSLFVIYTNHCSLYGSGQHITALSVSCQVHCC